MYDAGMKKYTRKNINKESLDSVRCALHELIIVGKLLHSQPQTANLANVDKQDTEP